MTRVTRRAKPKARRPAKIVRRTAGRAAARTRTEDLNLRALPGPDTIVRRTLPGRATPVRSPTRLPAIREMESLSRTSMPGRTVGEWESRRVGE